MALDPKTGQRMGRAAVITQLKALSKVRLKAVDIDEHISRLKSESDRGAMILAATIVDDALLTALERVVKCPNSEMRDKIFHGDGPLASFSRRITFAQALGIIQKKHADDINVIREVRNVAAHAHVEVDFTKKEIVAALGCMLDADQGDDLETWSRNSVRNYYMACCGIYADVVLGAPDPEDPDAIHGLYRGVRASRFDGPLPSQNK